MKIHDWCLLRCIPVTSFVDCILICIRLAFFCCFIEYGDSGQVVEVRDRGISLGEAFEEVLDEV